MIRRWVAVLAAAAVVAACGPGDEPGDDGALAAAEASPTSTATGGPTGSPTASATTAKPAGPPSRAPRTTTRAPRPRRTTSAPTTKPPSGGGSAIDVDLVGRGDPLTGGGELLTAMDQSGCGENDLGVTIHIDIPGTGRVKDVWFTYRVGTKTPFTGEQHDLTARGDLHYYHGVIGPFDARPENRAGGSISVVAHVVEGNGTEGKERTGRGTFKLNPCR